MPSSYGLLPPSPFTCLFPLSSSLSHSRSPSLSLPLSLFFVPVPRPHPSASTASASASVSGSSHPSTTGNLSKKKEGRVNVKFTGKAAAWLPFFKRSEGSRRAPRLKSRYGNGLFRVICSRASEEAARLRKRARKRCAWGANFPQA